MATDTPNTDARRTHMQVVHYLRKTVNWNDAGIATAGQVVVGKLPTGALCLPSFLWVITAFNAATTNVLSVGFEPTTNTNLITTAQAVAGTPGLKANLPGTGLALAPLTVDAIVYALYTQSGTAATAGQAIICIPFILNNDK